jgi:capsular polysaccharide transport system permease protein
MDNIKSPQSISKKIHANNAKGRLAFFLCVILPTIFTGLYYAFFASDIYVSHAKFSVQVEQTAIPALAEGFGQLLSQSSGGSNDSYIVKGFIESPSIVEKLNDESVLAPIFQNKKTDILYQLGDNPTKEDLYKFYQRMVRLKYDANSNILEMSARGFEAKDAQKLAQAILQETEDFVNKTSQRMQEDSVKFAKETADNAEQALLEINKKIMTFRNENENFDPSREAGGVIQIIQRLEGEKAAAEAELSAALTFFKPNSPKISSLRAKINGLNNQINEVNGNIARKGGAPLAELLEEYETLKAKQEFALQRYETALVSLETAQMEALQKRKYLISIVAPTLPETAEEPKRLYNTLTVFIVLLVAFGILKLVIEALHDNMS